MADEKRFVGAMPVGFIGTLAGLAMNLIHKRQYRAIIEGIREEVPARVSSIVDIGCGGGVALKHFAAVFPNAKITGIDYSRDMVELSLKANRNAVRSGRLTVRHNSVERMDIESDSADIITVFDNINFWEDYGRAFGEISRILKDTGFVYIINGYPEVGTKWHDFVKFKNDEAYRNLLRAQGITVEKLEIAERTIVIKGKKTAAES